MTDKSIFPDSKHCAVVFTLVIAIAASVQSVKASHLPIGGTEAAVISLYPFHFSLLLLRVRRLRDIASVIGHLKKQKEKIIIIRKMLCVTSAQDIIIKT